MKINGLLLALIFALTPGMWAQDKPTQAPPGSSSGNQMRAEYRQKMMEIHKQEMEAVRADYPHGQNAKEHGIDGTRHDARQWHRRPASYSANRKET